jgi:hypothetical protein
MDQDTKKIDFTVEEKVEYHSALLTWKGFLDWLRSIEDDEKAFKCMHFEIQNKCRPQFIDRARTRFNKLRTYRELKEIEKLTGKVISINYV